MVAHSGHTRPRPARHSLSIHGTLCQTPIVLAVGDTAPAFEVEDTEGKRLALDALVEEGPVIVALFPKAFTPG